jgi:hypothetical protein
MKHCPTLDDIRRLNLPAKAKAELIKLWYKARTLVAAIVRFIQRHREFSEAMLLGAIIAYILSKIPWIGMFLALCGLVTAAAIGVLKELRTAITRLLEPIPGV